MLDDMLRTWRNKVGEFFADDVDLKLLKVSTALGAEQACLARGAQRSMPRC